MRDHKIKHYFTIIDYGIKVFNADKGFKIDATQYRDWLVFDQRTMRRTKNGINYMIGIAPDFNENEELVSWQVGGSVWYDIESDRYATENYFSAKDVQLDFIAQNALSLLNEVYNHISIIKKEDIPFVSSYTSN